MSRFRLPSAALLAAILPMVASGQDEEEEIPDLAFLEYLGSWQEEDEEWYLEAELEGQPKKSRRERKRDDHEDE